MWKYEVTGVILVMVTPTASSLFYFASHHLPARRVSHHLSEMGFWCLQAARAEERLGQVVAGLGRKAWGIEQDGGSAGPKPPTESMNGSGRQHVMSLIEEMGEAEASDKVMGLIEEIVGAIEEALQGALLEARQNEDAVEGTEEVVCEFLRIQSNEGSFHAQQVRLSFWCMYA
jgi:hypothetical protein